MIRSSSFQEILTKHKEIYEESLRKYGDIDIWKPTIEYIEVSGDLAVLRRSGTESWTPKAGGETITINGKAVNVFRRGADGSWKMFIEIWNLNEPND